jgi:CubicO group peptidase (beta-lactamase class C family)
MTSLPPLFKIPQRAFALLAICVGFAGSGATLSAQDRFAGVPAAVQPFVEKGEISGAVMLVADGEKVLHLSAVGQSDLATGRKMETTDLFWIASMTKPITAVAVAMLVDEGLLRFDDAVEKYIPEFKNLWVKIEQSPTQHRLVHAKRPITVRDLLTHTSGEGEYVEKDPHWTLKQMTESLAREPLRFQPGEKWGYSTAGTDLLGRIVEVVGNEPFAEALQRRVFGPLGMKDTTFWVSRVQEPRCAHDYRPNPTTGKLEETIIPYLYGGEITDRARPPLGGAGLFSTAEDVAKFYQMMLHRGLAGQRRLLKPETVAEMTRNQTGNLKTRPGMPWGLGFCVVEDPSQMEANTGFSPGTFGHGGAHGTQSWADPTRGLVYVFMIQRDKMAGNPDNSPMRQAYQTVVAAALGITPVAKK